MNKIIELLKDFTRINNSSLEIIIIGGLALEYYGMKDRTTFDLDAEVKGEVEKLFIFLKSKGIPADISENISGWSIISLAPEYRERTQVVYKDERLSVKVLNQIDFIIAKLRRSTEEDINDALFIAKKFNIKSEDIQKNADEAIKNSPKDTALFVFKKNIEFFIKELP
ncbi:MAG: hypothetical protein HY934_01220 [Candidatus Firestonebacteria bacterium]|nr:hypothetical protein [Candidatus Firestonebacteria bacterium]